MNAHSSNPQPLSRPRRSANAARRGLHQSGLFFSILHEDGRDDSEVEAMRYPADHFDRNIVLITGHGAEDACGRVVVTSHKNRETPFPPQPLSASGRYDSKRPALAALA